MSFHSFTGQAPARQAQSQNFSQASTRHAIVCFDQHGRRWWASVENKSGMPSGALNPSFSAPWYPDQGLEFLVLNPDNTNELYINYEAMFRSRKLALRKYHADALQFASEKNIAAPAFGRYTEQFTNRFGKPPRAIELVVAASQNNPFILGSTKVVDPRLTPFLEHTSTTLEDLASDYDFSPESYAEATGTAPVSESDMAAQFDEIADDITDSSSDLDAEIDALDPLVDEDEEDPAALGGRTVHPRSADRAKRQAPRRPTQTARKGKGRLEPSVAMDATDGSDE